MKTAVVTGAAGFVGSNLVRKLLAEGWRVRGVDNLTHGFADNLDGLEPRDAFELFTCDVRDKQALRRVFAGAEVVAHLAAFKIPRYGNALETIRVNIHGTRAVLDVAAETDSKVVFTSTSDVYGKNPDLPFHEGKDLYFGAPAVRRWAYAESKLFDEHFCLARASERGQRVAVIRYFGGYGPRQNTSWWGGPQAVFIGQMLAGEPLSVHGDGLQTRTLTFVDDMVDGTYRAMVRDQANGEIINIGAGKPVTIAELAEKVARLMRPDEEPRIARVPYASFGRYEDVRHRVPDCTKARDLLGFVARTALDEGLPPTIAWHVQAVARRGKA